MAIYTVKGRTILGNKEIYEKFGREKDAIDFIKKLGAQQGINAHIVRIEEGRNYDYSYNSDRDRIIKILEGNNITYELDDNLNIKIIF